MKFLKKIFFLKINKFFKCGRSGKLSQNYVVLCSSILRSQIKSYGSQIANLEVKLYGAYIYENWKGFGKVQKKKLTTSKKNSNIPQVKL